jgi:hypothetical protein
MIFISGGFSVSSAILHEQFGLLCVPIHESQSLFGRKRKHMLDERYVNALFVVRIARIKYSRGFHA